MYTALPPQVEMLFSEFEHVTQSKNLTIAPKLAFSVRVEDTIEIYICFDLKGKFRVKTLTQIQKKNAISKAF